MRYSHSLDKSIENIPQVFKEQSSSKAMGSDAAENWIELLPQGIWDRIALHVARGVWNSNAQNLTFINSRWYRSVWDTLPKQVDLDLPIWVLQKAKRCDARTDQIETERHKMVEFSDGRPDYYEFHCWREVSMYKGLQTPEGMKIESDAYLRITDILNAVMQLCHERTLYLEFQGRYLRKLAIKLRRLSIEFTSTGGASTILALASARMAFGDLRLDGLWVAGEIEVPGLMNHIADLSAHYARVNDSRRFSVKWTAKPVRRNAPQVTFRVYMVHYALAIIQLPENSLVQVFHHMPAPVIYRKYHSFKTLGFASHATPPAFASIFGELVVNVVVHFRKCSDPRFSASSISDLHKLCRCSNLQELRIVGCSHILPTLAEVLKRLPLLRNLSIGLVSLKCHATLSTWSNVINSTHHSLKLDMRIFFKSLTQCRQLFKCFGHRLNRANVWKVGQHNRNSSVTEAMNYLEVCLDSIGLYNPNIACFHAGFLPSNAPLRNYPHRAISVSSRRIEMLAKKLEYLRPFLRCEHIRSWVIKNRGVVPEPPTNKRSGGTQLGDRRKRLRKT